MMLNILFCHTKKNEALGYKQVPQNDEKPVCKTQQGKLGMRFFCPIMYYSTSLKMVKISKMKRIRVYPLSYFFLAANIVLNLLNFFVGQLLYLSGWYMQCVASACSKAGIL